MDIMNNKYIDALVGVIVIIFWFMPLVNVENGTGLGLGSTLSYVIIGAAVLYTIFSWFELHAIRIIAGIVATVGCVMILSQYGEASAWGLFALTCASITAILFAVWDLAQLNRA